ncbi:M14 family zinc carboxypeptidase [Allomuricauda sp. SCSIO 65647]|uniref:M14 family zinc carboxypeptidase n=1 Tax=Allomuricauda sp. SCSIO 65647 TaxID=2908843 RepID=UPI001F37A91F|nr:M14 family zinc carboxypeptidase [Muricauda sp. SCSIO 65647]UJH67944.1 zinc carboxypeptidase [Muricauda sp. SCSIO 65647]
MSRFLLVLVILIPLFGFSQKLKSPSEFLSYELGTQFSRHHEVLDYFQYVAKSQPNRVKLEQYGMTNERRPLLLAFVSAAENLSNLEDIRQEHLNATTGNGDTDKAIVWLSYNVHGNESVSTEASMKTIYELLTTKSTYLENTVVVIDPCLNPDGRDRYTNWYNQYKNVPYQVDPNSREHHEGWWSGRSNHYMFDLNRDWAWLTQVESQLRLKVFNKWLPHVHVDFHEQGVNNPYYFAPAAEPYHEVITPFQRQFQETIGKNHAKYFDANGWFYFTKEVFDLFYPSYGDTYPTYNGAIGMTYEQGGSGRAGLGVITKIGDTLTLKDRIAHHLTTGLSTVEVAANNVEKLNDEFEKFYKNRNFKYKSYLLNGNMDNIKALEELLAKHNIDFGRANNGSVKGFRYRSGTSGSMKTSENSLVVSTNQPKGTLVKVLFEPNAKLSDSLTYDITAWSLPYAYGLDAVASTTLINSSDASAASAAPVKLQDAYAHITDWNSMQDARFLAALIKNGVRVRTAYHPFSIEGKTFERGSLIITKADNEKLENFLDIVSKIAKKYSKSITSTDTGFVDMGKDFGSAYVQMIERPKVAVLSGDPTSTLRFGEVWHFFEQQLHYPLTVIDADYFDRVDMNNYNIVVLPSGGYGQFFNEKRLKKLKSWVAKGGKIVAMGGAIGAIDGENGFGIKQLKKEKDSATSKPEAHENIQRERMKEAITGAIFKVKVDNTHPLGYGYGREYYTLKLGSTAFEYLKKGNVAYFEENTKPVSGFAGSKAQKSIGKTLVFGVEEHGKGQVIYMVDNPLFRGFWENGKLFFANALFMVN